MFQGPKGIASKSRIRRMSMTTQDLQRPELNDDLYHSNSDGQPWVDTVVVIVNLEWTE